jgi:hypothetical protein
MPYVMSAAVMVDARAKVYRPKHHVWSLRTRLYCVNGEAPQNSMKRGLLLQRRASQTRLKLIRRKLARVTGGPVAYLLT